MSSDVLPWAPDSDRQCRECPDKAPISAKSDPVRCGRCNSPFHQSCAERAKIDPAKGCRHCKKYKIHKDPFDDLKSFFAEDADKREKRFNSRLDKVDSTVANLDKKVSAKLNDLKEAVHELRQGQLVTSKKLEELEGVQKNLDDRVNKLESTTPSNLEKASQTAVEAAVKESTQRLINQRNLIIYGIPESGESSIRARHEADSRIIESLLETFPTSLSNGQFQLIRLGSSTHVAESRPRPLKIILSSLSDALSFKNMFLEQKKLATALPILKDLSITTDKTRMQQREFKQAKDILQKRLDKGETNLYISTRNGFPEIRKRKTLAQPDPLRSLMSLSETRHRTSSTSSNKSLN